MILFHKFGTYTKGAGRKMVFSFDDGEKGASSAVMFVPTILCASALIRASDAMETPQFFSHL